MARMPRIWRSGSLAVRVVRAALLVIGLATAVVAFIGLVDERLVVARAAPWWYVGLVGVAAVLLALGSPRATPPEE